jgi:hypothetical protein
MSPVTVRRARLGPSGSGSGEGDGENDGSGDLDGLSDRGDEVGGSVGLAAEPIDPVIVGAIELPGHADVAATSMSAPTSAAPLLTRRG